MVNFATLGMVIDNAPAVKSTQALDGLTAAAGRTEAAYTKLGTSASRMGNSVSSDLARVARQSGAMQLDVQRFSDAVGGAVVPIGTRLPEAALKGEYALGRLERQIVSLGIGAAGISGEGGHIAHLAATLASLGEGGAPVLALLGGAAAIGFALEQMNKEAAETAKHLVDVHKAALLLGETKAGTAVRNLGDINAEVSGLETSNAYHSGVLQQAFDTGNAKVYAAQLEIINQNLDKINQDMIEAARFKKEAGDSDTGIAKKHADEVQQEEDFVRRLNEEIAQGTKAAYDAAMPSMAANEKANEEYTKQLNEVYEGTRRLADVNPEWRASMVALVPVMNQLFGSAEGNRQEALANMARLHDSIAAIGLELNNALKGWDKQSAAEKKFAQDLHADFSHFFDDLLTNGLSSFSRLFDSVRQMFFKLAADMAAAKLMEQLAPSMGGEGAIVGGAGAGAAANPAILVAAAGLAVLTGVLSWIHSAAAEAERLAKALKDFNKTVQSYAQEGTLAGQIQAERDRAQALKDQALVIEHQTADVDAYYAALARINEVERQHIDAINTQAAVDAETARQDAIKKTIEIEKQALQAELDADQKKLDSAQQLLDATTRTVGTLQSYYHELLRLTASPIQDIGMAKTSLQDLAAKALAGDQDAANQLPDAARQFLDLSRQYNASGSGYTADVQYVQDILGPIIDFYQKQQTDQQKMVDLLQQQLDVAKQSLAALTVIDPSVIGHPPPSFAGAPGVADETAANTGQMVQMLAAGFQQLSDRLESLEATVSTGDQSTTHAIEGLKVSMG